MYEVELKFPVSDPSQVVSRLDSRGATRDPPVEQVDRYFNHPSRDFAVTDEAFRVRSVSETNFVTYKGPVVDTQTKTRREIETLLADGPAVAAQMVETLTLLGFRPVREVRKSRVIYHLTLSARDYEIAVDRVVGLGSFVEIETLADESSRHAARDAILALAAELGLSGAERKSYLCLLLEQDSRTSAT